MIPSKKTLALIASIDERLNKSAGWNERQVSTWANSLIKFGSVEVGWRESCGSTDATSKKYAAWKRVVTELKKDGLKISEVRQKHGNAWATKCGGFWNSIVYRAEEIGEQA